MRGYLAAREKEKEQKGNEVAETDPRKRWKRKDETSAKLSEKKKEGRDAVLVRRIEMEGIFCEEKDREKRRARKSENRGKERKGCRNDAERDRPRRRESASVRRTRYDQVREREREKEREREWRIEGGGIGGTGREDSGVSSSDSSDALALS